MVQTPDESYNKNVLVYIAHAVLYQALLSNPGRTTGDLLGVDGGKSSAC